MWSLHVCVSFNHPYTTGESIQNRTQNRTNCVTHSPVTLSYILTRNPWQSSVRCYTPSTLTAVNDPKGKPTLYIYIYNVLKASLSTVFLPPNGRCSSTVLWRLGSAGCTMSLVRNSWEDQLPPVCKAQAWLPARIKVWHNYSIINITVLSHTSISPGFSSKKVIPYFHSIKVLFHSSIVAMVLPQKFVF